MGSSNGEAVMTEGFTFEFTEAQLAKMIPKNKNVGAWYGALCDVLPKYEINTPRRVSAFLAQCCHESMQFTAVSENLNYKATSLRRVFTKYFTEQEAAAFAGKPEQIANRVYANRMGNGPATSGDGYRYRGRGLIQLTGKENYQKFADSIKMPLEDMPEYLTSFEGCVKSACWFWHEHHLNALADTSDLATITKRINGGLNGFADRSTYYATAVDLFVA